MGFTGLFLKALFAVVVLAVLIIWVVFPFIENHMIFYNWAWPERSYKPLSALENPILIKKIHEIYFPSLDKTRLNAWYIPAKQGKPTILFAHGNWGSNGIREGIFELFSERGYGVFGFDYRGYGLSQKRQPTEKGAYMDMAAASNYMAEQLHIPVSNQIAVGESLGTAITVQTALTHPFKAVLLFAAFTNTTEAAHLMRKNGELGWLGILPVEYLIKQKFDSYGKIGRLKMPIVMAHGEDDGRFPVAMAKRLYRQVTSPCKAFLIIPDATHISVFYDGAPQIFAALDKALACEAEHS